MTTFNLDWQVDTSQIDRLVNQLQATKTNAEAAAKSLDGVTGSVGRTTTATHAFSLANAGVVRELSVMFGEAVRGNWTRLEGSLTVLANRTGLLQMAFTPLGATIGIATLAIGAMAIAATKGAEEQNKLLYALASTGNYAGTTAANLRDLTLSVGEATHNFSGAKDAVLALASSGRFSADQISRIAPVITAMSADGGQKVGSLVNAFVRLKDEPAKAAYELDKQYHFLTAAIYEQILALDKQGKSDEAASLAVNALADSEAKATASIAANMGTLQRLAHDGADAFHKWWNEVLGIGRAPDANSALADIDKRIAYQQTLVNQAKNAPGAGPNAGSGEEAALEALKAQRAELSKMKSLVDDNAAAQGRLAAEEDKRKKGLNTLEATESQYLPKLEMERKELERIVDAAKAAGKSQADIEKIKAGFWANHPQNTRHRNDGNNTEIAALQGDIERKRVLYETDVTNLETSLKRGDITQEQFDDHKLQLQEQMLQAQEKDAEDAAKIAQKKGAGFQAEVQRWTDTANKFKAEIDKVHADRELAEQQHANKLSAIWASLSASYDRSVRQQLLSMQKQNDRQFMSPNQLGLANAQDTENARFVNERSKLEEDFSKNGGGDLQWFINKLDELKKKHADALDSINAKWKEGIDAQHDWKNGAQQAFDTFIEQAQDTASQTKTLFADAFDGLNNALINFAETGKLNFGDLTKKVIEDLLLMEIKSQEVAIFKGISSSGGMASIGASIASFFGFANGGVFNAYASGDVVNGPRFFAGGAGLMGEAGPEAIMPLKRGADGRLGVAIQGGNQSGQQNITYDMSVNVSGNADQNTVKQLQQQQAKQMQTIRSMIVSEINNQQRVRGALSNVR
jgi:lambda family phage tail tape measure protein